MDWTEIFSQAQSPDKLKKLLCESILILSECVEGNYNPDESASGSIIASRCRGVEEGHHNRMLLYKYLICEFALFRYRADLRNSVLCLMAYDISTRWALTGWSPLGISGKIAWETCNPVQEDMGSRDIWIDFCSALEIFHFVVQPASEDADIPTSDFDDVSQTVATEDPSKVVEAPYCVELWQIISLTLGHFLLESGGSKTGRKCLHLVKLLVELIWLHDKRMAQTLYACWLEPLCSLASGDNDLLSWIQKLSKEIADAHQPLALLHKPLTGVKPLRPLYASIESATFLQDAQELGMSLGEKSMHNELKTRRNLRREQRSMGKQVAREASKVESLVLQDAKRHQQKLQREQKRVMAVLHEDESQFKKMKTFGGTMDTSLGAYRPSKKQRVKKGSHRNP